MLPIHQVLQSNKCFYQTELVIPNASSSTYVMYLHLLEWLQWSLRMGSGRKLDIKISRHCSRLFLINWITFSCILFYIANFGYVLSLKVLFYLLWSLVMYNTVKLVKLKYFKINFNSICNFQLRGCKFSWFSTNH